MSLDTRVYKWIIKLNLIIIFYRFNIFFSKLRSKQMNKSDLVAAIADNSGLSKADAARALEATTSAISGALASGDSVAITGFGSFLVRARAARTGRNPQTGASIQISASNAPAFKAGKLLKESVN
jgi:DNA-binding protein HU-beta